MPSRRRTSVCAVGPEPPRSPAAAPHPGDAVLELACGTGDLARQLVARVGADGQVLATDDAPAMVSLAAASLAGCPQASTAIVDAAATGLAAESFDAVICAMGLMFLPDPTAALACPPR